MKKLFAVLFCSLLVIGILLYYYRAFLSAEINISPEAIWRALVADKTIVREPSESIVFAPAAPEATIGIDDSGIYPVYLLAVRQSSTDKLDTVLTVLHTQKNRNIIFSIPYLSCANPEQTKLEVGKLYQMGLVSVTATVSAKKLQQQYPDFMKKCGEEAVGAIANSTPIARDALKAMFRDGRSVGRLPTIVLGPYRFLLHSNSLHAIYLKQITHETK